MPNLASCAPILANWRYRKASIAAMSPTSRIRHIGYVTPDLAGDYVLPHTVDVPAPGLQLLDLSRVGHPLTPSLYSRVVILVWTHGGRPNCRESGRADTEPTLARGQLEILPSLVAEPGSSTGKSGPGVRAGRDLSIFSSNSRGGSFTRGAR